MKVRLLTVKFSPNPGDALFGAMAGVGAPDPRVVAHHG